jgi:hypothetical protein
MSLFELVVLLLFILVVIAVLLSGTSQSGHRPTR